MITVDKLDITLGDFSLKNLSFSIPEGAYAVLMGKTGSGKTTILECLTGLRMISSGTIQIGERDVTRLNPALRGIGYVPQDGALFSKMTVHDHLAYALQIRRTDRKQIAERVEELSALLGLSHLLNRLPNKLSGGESQRVALGRALSFRPRVLCLDEPLSALDRETREQMCELLGKVREQTNVTTIQVTHNPEETASLADCVYRLEEGTIHLESSKG